MNRAADKPGMIERESFKTEMTTQWLPEVTSTHQDHVIAHVIGATVLGYFILDESLHVLLDIGFIWTVYLDGQMVMLPQTAALQELDVDADIRNQLSREIEMLDRSGGAAQGLAHFSPAPVDCLITGVEFFTNEECRRLVLLGEIGDLTIETSLATAKIEVVGSLK